MRIDANRLSILALLAVLGCERPPEPPRPAPALAPTPEPEPVLGRVLTAPEPPPPPPPRYEKRVRLKVKATTWREGAKPYDIGAACRKKLAAAGIEAVSDGPHDAGFEVSYEERQGELYRDLVDPDRRIHATDVSASFILSDDKDLFLQVIVVTSKEAVVTGKGLHEAAVDQFLAKPDYRYLEHYVAATLGIAGAQRKVVEAALFEDSRRTALEVLQKTGHVASHPEEKAALALARGDLAAAAAFGKDAVPSLLLLFEGRPQDLYPHEILEALVKIADPRAERPILDRLRLYEGYEPMGGVDPVPLIDALGALGGAESGRQLAWIRDHADPEIRTAARQALKRIGQR